MMSESKSTKMSNKYNMYDWPLDYNEDTVKKKQNRQ